MEPQKNKKIILIEDDQFIRDLYKRELEKAGITSDAFRTGNEGLKALEDNTYELLLLDLMLPDTNGIEVLKKIRSNPKTQKLKILVITNLGAEPIVDEAFKLGAVGYLIKASYNPDQMIREINKHLVVE